MKELCFKIYNEGTMKFQNIFREKNGGLKS